MPYDLNSAMAAGQALMAPEAQPLPQETPEQFMARLQQWRVPGSELITPQNEALLRIGTQLMQPTLKGQSLGNVGQAIAGGVDTYNTRTRQDLANSLALENASQGRQAATERSAQSAETLAGSRLARGTAMATASNTVETASLALRQAQAQVKALEAQAAAGANDPAFLKRKMEADVALKEAQTAMYKSHAQFYGNMGGKGKQTLSVNVHDNGDGTMTRTTTTVINGKLFQLDEQSPRYRSEAEARAAATREVQNETPGVITSMFGKQAPYQGLPAQEIDRRAREYMTPKVTIRDETGQVLTPEQYRAISAEGEVQPQSVPAAGAATSMPPAFPAPQSKQQYDKATTDRIRALNVERQKIVASGGDPSSIDRELQTTRTKAKTAMRPTEVSASTLKPPAASAQSSEFVRDASGKLVPKGAVVTPPGDGVQNVGPVATAEAKLLGAQMALQSANQKMMTFNPQKMAATPDLWRAVVQDVIRRKAELASVQNEVRQARVQEAGQEQIWPTAP
jgi:hypothetical protein